MNPIQKYLYDKLAGVSQDKFEVENFTAYPLDIVDSEGELREGFLQDADTQVDPLDDGGSVHTLRVLWLEKETNKVRWLIKKCTNRSNCIVRWDEVHCSFDQTGINFKEEDEETTVEHD